MAILSTRHASAACYGCLWRDHGYEVRKIAKKARRHHATTGHRVYCVTETRIDLGAPKDEL